MVIVGTPTTGSIQAETAACIVRLCQHTPETEFKPLGCTFLPQARTQLVQYAMQQGASHILFVDGDMRFPPDALDRLLRHRAWVVGANYRRRSSAGHKFTATRNEHQVSSVGLHGLEAVDFIGLGLALVDLSVFLGGCTVDQWFPATLFQNEDVAFCKLVRSLGYDVLVDHDLSQDVGHVYSDVLTVSSHVRA